MTGFEPVPSGIVNNQAVNCATTAAQTSVFQKLAQ